MPGLSFQIGIYAPAGAVRDLWALQRAEAFLKAAGHVVCVDSAACNRAERFAGSDAERLDAVTRMREDARIELALAARGGYGWSRLLDQLDYAAFAHDATFWLGHSDFTAFQLALLARAGRVTFAGPMACSDFGAPQVSSFTFQHCFDLLAAMRSGDTSDAHAFTCRLESAGASRTLDVEGILWGGNLTMVTHLLGTPYFPEIENGILFLEDVGEHPYRIERMLYQLLYSGVLARQQVVLLGAFSAIRLVEHDCGYDLAAAVRHIREKSCVPFLSGLPFGHVRDKLTLPVGAICRLTLADDGAATLRFRMPAGKQAESMREARKDIS
ncbi:MAG: LD-carboxypeptidase [Zoogloeaceae bacterium]|jgi:muramoyltetrapeptide carboxypeptidase|nr:LD-carboxypeptidase [Zoogloeaceae bacterium]